MQIYIIVAADEKGCIGKDGRIPWNYPEDLKSFKELTTGHAVIMGRKTYESLPSAFRPLPDRINIVLSRNENECRYDVDHYKAGSVESALRWCIDNECDQIFIAGGAEIYKAAMPFTDIIYLTHIPGQFDGDTFFPEWPIDETKWFLISTCSRRGLDVSSYSNLNRRHFCIK